MDEVVRPTGVDAHTVTDLSALDVSLIATDTVSAHEGTPVDGTGAPKKDDTDGVPVLTTHRQKRRPSVPTKNHSRLFFRLNSQSF